MDNNKIGKVLGTAKTRQLNVANQTAPYIQSEYLIINDELQGKLPCEVIETTIIPFANDNVLPDGCVTEFIKAFNFDEKKPLFFAKVKILKELPYPVMPGSEVVHAKYEEISNIIIKANPDDCMVVGIIKGTELSQGELPEKLQNVAPLWEKGSAVKQKGIPLLLNHHTFREYPHIGLFGSSGSGKSFALRVICEELMKLDIPILGFDPHYELKFEGNMEGLDDKFKTDFADKYEEFVIGENVGIRFEDLNTSELLSLFEFVDPLTEPQKNAVESLFEKGETFVTLQKKIVALKEAFEIMDGKKNTGKLTKVVEPDLLNAFQSDLYHKYKTKVSGAVSLQALAWKCSALEKTKIFTQNISKVKSAILNRKFAVIRGDIGRLQMISSYLISKLYKARRKYKDDKTNEDYFPPFFIVLDEAHNFAPEGNHSTPTKSIIRNIGQEARKYGVFLITCTQVPKSLDGTLLKQLSTKFIFRLADQTDMDVAKRECNLTDAQVSMLPDLSSGNCFVNSPVLNKTYPVRFRTTFTKAPNVEDPFEELKKRTGHIESKLEEVLMDFLPLTTIGMARAHKNIRDAYGGKVEIEDIIACLENMVKKNLILKDDKNGIGIRYDKI